MSENKCKCVYCPYFVAQNVSPNMELIGRCLLNCGNDIKSQELCRLNPNTISKDNALFILRRFLKWNNGEVSERLPSYIVGVAIEYLIEQTEQ